MKIIKVQHTAKEDFVATNKQNISNIIKEPKGLEDPNVKYMQKKPTTVKKPWGKYVILEKTNTYWIKKLYVNNNARFSLQSHNKRCEMWFVLTGKIIAHKGNKKYRLNKGDIIKINKKEKHRIEGVKNALILELAFGNVKERDIIRYQDDYGRIK